MPTRVRTLIGRPIPRAILSDVLRDCLLVFDSSISVIMEVVFGVWVTVEAIATTVGRAEADKIDSSRTDVYKVDNGDGALEDAKVFDAGLIGPRSVDTGLVDVPESTHVGLGLVDVRVVVSAADGVVSDDAGCVTLGSVAHSGWHDTNESKRRMMRMRVGVDSRTEWPALCLNAMMA
jgi:hypothetical protein